MRSLLDSLKQPISPDVVRGSASNLGQSTDSVQLALQNGSAAMLATLAGKAQDQGFLSQIKNLIYSFGARKAMGAAAGGGASVRSTAAQAGSSFLNMLFGRNLSNATGKLAEASGMRASSAGKILAAAAPMYQPQFVAGNTSYGAMWW
jgi:hypothetical protein